MGLVIPLFGLKNHTPIPLQTVSTAVFLHFRPTEYRQRETDSPLKATILVGGVSILFLVFSSFLANFRHFLSLTGHLDILTPYSPSYGI